MRAIAFGFSKYQTEPDAQFRDFFIDDQIYFKLFNWSKRLYENVTVNRLWRYILL